MNYVPACECYAAAVVLTLVVACRRIIADCFANVFLARESGAKEPSGAHQYARA